MKISCCLITKEKEYPPLVLERLTCANFFDEIIIKTESPSVYQRYELAKQAKNDVVFFQDDDIFVNYQILFSHYDGKVTNTMTLPFKQKYEDMGCTLVGWGCYFPVSMLNVFDKYIAMYGEDEHLLREADRIFTYMNKPFNTIIMPHEDLPQGEDRMSSPQNYEAHMASAYEAIRKCSLL